MERIGTVSRRPGHFAASLCRRFVAGGVTTGQKSQSQAADGENRNQPLDTDGADQLETCRDNPWIGEAVKRGARLLGPFLGAFLGPLPGAGLVLLFAYQIGARRDHGDDEERRGP